MKFVSEDGNTRIFEIPFAKIIEQGPGCRSFNCFFWNSCPGQERRFHVFFPYKVYIIREHPCGTKSLHFGLRTEPLPEVLDFELLCPPIPNIYTRWLLFCSVSDVKYFWNSTFNYFDDWLGCVLLKRTKLKSFKNWQKLSPEQCVKIFEKWPDCVTGTDNNQHIQVFDKHKGTIKTRLPISEVLEPIPRDTLRHIADINLEIRP